MRGNIISYIEMCQKEGSSLQKGMNFRLKGKHSVILMSVRENSPYQDEITEDGTVLIYEGKDIKFLKHFQNLLFPETNFPFGVLPNMPIGGWSGWAYAVGSAMLFTNAFEEQIATYCILDSDYYAPEKIKNRYDEAIKKNVNLHIWKRKEIENYLIVPSVIERIITKNSNNGSPTVNEIDSKISNITNSLKNQTIDCFSQEFHNEERSKGIASANKKASELVENSWSTNTERLCVVSGKTVISKLSSWATENFGVSFGVNTLLHEIQVGELDQEVTEVVSSIENSITQLSLSGFIKDSH